MTALIHLENRQLIAISGKDRFDFLQGLISNDINEAKEKPIYSLMLNPQGRFLFEFFISNFDDTLIIETAKSNVDLLLKKLSFYKLRSEVEISKINDLQVFFIDDVSYKCNFSQVFLDPRKANFGLRLYGNLNEVEALLAKDNLLKQSLDYYNLLRIKNKIVDETDLVFDQSLVVELGFDDLNAISYKKGCYVGQEVVARAHYRGQIRKKLFLIEIKDLKEIALNSEITWQSKKQGVVLSSLFFQDRLWALALIKNFDADGLEIDLASINLEVESGKSVNILA